MSLLNKVTRRGAVATAILALSACSSMGSLGSILGGVLGQGSGNGDSVSGTVRSVDTRSQQISIQQSNGQTVQLLFDNRTSVSYQNQNYPVTSLENGDQVTARVQAQNNGGYYTDLIQVDQSARGGTTSGNAQSFQGTVRQVDQSNGLFTLTVSGGSVLTVSMPYNPSRTDLSRFQNLRSGDFVRFYGVYLSNSRVELRQFY